MNQIILTTPEELRAIVSESVSQTLAGLTLPKDEPDNLTWKFPDVYWKTAVWKLHVR